MEAVEKLQRRIAKEHPEWLEDFAAQWRSNPPREPQPKSPPAQLSLEVPYLSQRDNWCNPHGSCNVTSVAMTLAALGCPTHVKGEQLEDVLYRYMSDTGLDRHSPDHLAILIREVGVKPGLRFTALRFEDDYTSKGTWQDAIEALATGYPCIVHGWFTRFGHIMVIKGYTEQGWIANDPYGVWDGYQGYSAQSGESVEYGNDEMEYACGPNGTMWLHRVRLA